MTRMRCSKAGLDLKADVVVGVVERMSAFIIGNGQPPSADQSDHDRAGADRGLDGFGEVGTHVNRVQVHEDGRVGKPLVEPDFYQACVGAGVLSSVVDEYSVRHTVSLLSPRTAEAP
jgi:hypothetical protein